jgi:acetyl-CoA synthetase
MCERSNSDAWRWYRDVIGGNRCPIVDTWWQTETGAIMIAPLPGVTAAKPGSPVTPLPGISAHIVDDDADLVALGEQGQLVLDRPWPSMLRGIWGDDERFVETYWSRFGQRAWCFTGVDAGYDDEDAIWVLSRGDDVMNVSVHDISTAEVESATASSPVAKPRDIHVVPELPKTMTMRPTPERRGDVARGWVV